MPLNPLKTFARRRSSGNVLDTAPETTPPAQSSFRVLERPRESRPAYGGQNGKDKGRLSVGRPFHSQLPQRRGKSADDLALGPNRGSGGTTNSGSSGYYDSSAASARHSSSSTLPSSLEQDREPENEELFPRDTATSSMIHSVPREPDAPPPPPPSFSLRASRVLSFGNKSTRPPADTKLLPAVPTVPLNGAPKSPERSHSPHRDRSMTTSSYASTAVPTRQEPNFTLGDSTFGADFGEDDFGNMFGNLGKQNAHQSREYLPTPPPPAVGGTFHRTESEPMFPLRSYARQTPSPGASRMRDAESPYSLDGRNSHDGLFSDSALDLPKLEDGPPVPSHGRGIASAFLGGSKGAYSLVPPDQSHSPVPGRTSSDSRTGFMSDKAADREVGHKQGEPDERDSWIKRVELHDGPALSETASTHSFATADSAARPTRKPIGQSQASAGASRLGDSSAGRVESTVKAIESNDTTPKAPKLVVNTFSDEPLFDSSPLGPASQAIRPGHTRTQSGTPKKMTKAQFDMLQRYGDSSREQSVDEPHEDDEYDDEDEAERAKQATRQRRKQEANMAIYRQQMKKVTGGGPSDLPATVRPPLERTSHSAPYGLYLGGMGGTPPMDAVRGKQAEDDDEDVPLGVLQAHGFPGAGRPPIRMGETEAQRRVSVAGSVAGGGAGQGSLPPFARRLPADPYFGSSLVNQGQRESLTFNGAGSVYGGTPAVTPQGHPAGLVGVIAGEERARASRRGSPNPVTGTYGPTGPIPLPTNMPPQMPGMPGLPRTMSMGNVVPPQTYHPSGLAAIPAMPMMPGMPMIMPPDQTQQQMQHFMQMQMQFMQNMMAMQQQQTLTQSPQPQTPTPDYLGVPMPDQRRVSMASQASMYQNPAPPPQGRAMTMMHPPTRWDILNAQQRPTSAMPGLYAPSVRGMNGNGPAAGYTPSIAPSERSNIGMPSRYRPVTMDGGASGRSQSMTSSLTLQALQGNPRASMVEELPSQNTIRVIDKPKGTPKVFVRPVDEDEDAGWAEMAKKRTEKKFGWRRKNVSEPALTDPSLSDLYADYQ